MNTLTVLTSIPTYNKPVYPIFSATLGTLANTAETGQALQYSGDPVPYVKDGIPCLYMDNSQVYTTDVESLPKGKEPLSISLWIWFGATDVKFQTVLNLGVSQDWKAHDITYNYRNYITYGAYGGPHRVSVFPSGRWVHYVMTFDGE